MDYGKMRGYISSVSRVVAILGLPLAAYFGHQLTENARQYSAEQILTIGGVVLSGTTAGLAGLLMGSLKPQSLEKKIEN